MVKSNGLPDWLVWIGGPSAIAAWFGLLLSLRREFHERPRLRFLFEATSSFYYPDDGEQVCTHAVGATITNMGAHPISLGEIVCEFRAGYSPNEITSRKEGLNLITISRGEPKLAWVRLFGKPTKVETVFFIDTTGRRWKPNRREKKQLISECARIWP